MKAEAVIEFGCGEEYSFWVGVEWERVGRWDDACFAEFGGFAEIWILVLCVLRMGRFFLVVGRKG